VAAGSIYEECIEHERGLAAVNVNAWGDDVGFLGLMSIGIMVIGLTITVVLAIIGSVAQEKLGRRNAITEFLDYRQISITVIGTIAILALIISWLWR
jgi:uncharacterized membrane protein YdbT with pleckstrin-like domain